MAEYYFISQLPSLDGVGENSQIPITEDRFLELSERFLKGKTLQEIQSLSLVPSIGQEQSTSMLIQTWNEGERNLRLALAKVRADKLNKTFALSNKNLPAELIKVASDAIEIDSPLQAEYFLLNYRLKFLESIRPMDSFSQDFIFYYGIKLKLLFRIKQFDTQIGKTEYAKIYSSIIEGDKVEANNERN